MRLDLCYSLSSNEHSHVQASFYADIERQPLALQSLRAAAPGIWQGARKLRSRNMWTGADEARIVPDPNNLGKSTFPKSIYEWYDLDAHKAQGTGS